MGTTKRLHGTHLKAAQHTHCSPVDTETHTAQRVGFCSRLERLSMVENVQSRRAASRSVDKQLKQPLLLQRLNLHCGKENARCAQHLVNFQIPADESSGLQYHEFPAT